MKQNLFQSPIGRLRITAFAEGVSFLILLGIAMPLKYFAGMPLAVKIAGMTHGVLFILFLFSLIDVKITHRWTIAKSGMAFASSLLPFGTFVLDTRVLKKEMHNIQTP
jgi:integral membrane protein